MLGRCVNSNLATRLFRSAVRDVLTKLQLYATSVAFLISRLVTFSNIHAFDEQNCYTKPKFPPYEFCGKKCAAAAASIGLTGPGAIQAPAPVQTIPTHAPLLAANARAGGYAKTLPPKPYISQGPPAGKSLSFEDVATMIKVTNNTLPPIASQPQHSAPLPAPRRADLSKTAAIIQPPVTRRADLSKTATIVQPPANIGNNAAATVLQSVKQAFSTSSQPQQLQPQKSESYSQGSTKSRSSQTLATAPPPALDCLIPGCGKPVHVDENGYPASAYCSQRHRE